ncbi:MAG: hypothetical protein LUP99_05615 [Methanomicrobiales archaeon]|nr:hypothetical protein [Methanomicrobiales archaeon]
MHAYEVSVWEQEALVRERPEPIREEIRTILAYVPKSYTPPEKDMEESYREATDAHHFGFGV